MEILSTTVWLHHLDSNETPEEKLDRNYTRMLCDVLNPSLKAYLNKNNRCTATYLPSHKPSK